MDENLRAIRRRRRRERRLLRRLANLGPLALVALAWALSAGLVKVMEVKPAAVRELEEKAPATDADAAPRLLSSQDTRPELPAMLATSILDHEVSAVDDGPAARAPGDCSLPGRSPAPRRGAPGDYCTTPSSSTSKVSTAPGGMTPGTPVSP